ncbi:MAG: hypothetical protein ACYCSN_15475 [Acidobacteriaceae bacterium]
MAETDSPALTDLGAQSTPALVSTDSSPLQAPETLKQTQAARELQQLQLVEVADLLVAIRKMADPLLEALRERITEIDRTLADARKAKELQFQETEREVLWFRTVQGEFRVRKLPEENQPTEADVKLP